MKLVALSIVLLFSATLGSFDATAQTLYWDTNGTTSGTDASSTANWNGTTDWTTDLAGNSTTIGYVSGDSVVFSAGSNGTGAENITVNGATSTAGITINNGAVTLLGSSAALSIGAGGVTINSPDGTTTFDSSLGTITLSASQTWNEDSAQAFNVGSGITSTSGTLTFDGTGSGTTTISGAIGGSTSIVQESASSTLFLDQANNFSGSLTVSAGTVRASADTSVGNDGNTLNLSNGGTVSFTGPLTFNHNVVATTAAGGALNFTGDSVLSGTYTATVLTLSAGDALIATSGNQSIKTLDLVGSGTINTNNRMILGINSPDGNGFISGSTINVSNAYTLDFGAGGTYANTISMTSGTALENRGGNASFSNLVLPTSGTITIGSDDVGGGSLTINNGEVLNGTLTLNVTGHGSSVNSTPVFLSGALSGSGTLNLDVGAGLGSYLYLQGNNSYSGSTVINSLTVFASGSGFGTSTVTLNGATVNLLNGDYAGTDNTNQFILGTGTNLINGVNGITTFSGSVINGAGTVLHLTGSNNTIDPSASTVSNFSTLDIDSGRTFLMKYGLNFIANNTTVNVAWGTTLDFDTGSIFSSSNLYTFNSGAGLTLRDDGGTTNATLSNVALPTSGSFTIGSDDEANEGGSITIGSGLVLTGNLAIDANDSSGSTVVSTLGGNISGAGGLSLSSGPNGAGILHLTGTNSYSGSTTVNAGLLDIKGNNTAAGAGYVVNAGTLQIGSGGSISTAANVTLGSGSTSGTLALGDSSGAVSQTVASLTTSGSGLANAVVGGGSASVSTLTINNSSADTFAGTIGGAGTNQNLIALTKSGAGTLSLSGTNTYTGGTTVNAGKLAVDGSIAGGAAIAAGAELGGHGKIGGTISGAGAVGPGNSPGILSAAAVNPAAGTSFNFEFTLAGGPTYSNASASGNDVLHLEGGTPFTSALGSGNVINLYFAAPNISYQGGFFINGTASALAADLAGATFNYYLEDDANGAVTYNGVKYDLTRGTQSTIAVTGAAFADGPTNGATEIFTAPEPSTYGLFLLGGAGLFFLNWRPRRVQG